MASEPPVPHVHSWRFDGDDPYLVCDCGARQDALTGLPTRDLRDIAENALPLHVYYRDGGRGEFDPADLGRLLDRLRGAEAELLALRPVVEAAVAWAIPWKEPEEAMAANGALVDAVAHYQRGLSGRAVFPIQTDSEWPEDWLPNEYDRGAKASRPEAMRADAARASREPSE